MAARAHQNLARLEGPPAAMADADRFVIDRVAED
jgi:hypothetical protein